MDTPSTEALQAEANRVIDALGGTVAVATLCRIRSPSVSGWRLDGIPEARMQFFRLLRPDLFEPVELDSAA